MNRTFNTVRNTFWGFLNICIGLFLPFITRTCIIYVLGNTMVGLSSLFTSILGILSLAELGFGNAIVYSMYKPVAENNIEQISALMNLYRKIYRFIGFIILCVGLTILPFIENFISGNVPDKINVYIIFIIYLFNTICTYWLFAYKTSILFAFQRNDIYSKITIVCNSLMYLGQIVAIVFLKNFYLYAMLMLISNIVINLVTSKVVDMKFSIYKPNGKIDKQLLNTIKKQVLGLLSQKLAFSSRNALDSIIISSFIGLTMVAIYNNYFLILSAATAILGMIFSSMQAAIGNSIVSESKDKNFKDMRKINFIYMGISGLVTIIILLNIQLFMKIWVGSSSMFDDVTVLLLAIYFFFMKITDSIGAYIAATGIWWKCKEIYLLETLINVLLNIVFGYYFGIKGIIVASMISVTVVNYFFTLRKIFSYFFQNKGWITILTDDIIYFFSTFTIAGVIYAFYTFFLNNILVIDSMYISLFVHGAITLIISIFLYYIMYRRMSIYKISVKWLWRMSKR